MERKSESKNKNRLGAIRFFTEHIFWGVVIGFVYHYTLFRRLKASSDADSHLMLTAFVCIASLFCIGVDIGKRQNYGQIFVNLMIGFGAYTLLAYFDQLKIFCIVLLGLIGIMTVLYGVYMLSRKNRTNHSMWSVLKMRLDKIFLVSRYLMTFCAVLLSAISMVKVAGEWMTPEENHESSYYAAPMDYEACLEKNSDQLAKLDEQVWETLNPVERLEVLRTLSEVEKSSLGISCPIIVHSETMFNRQTLGYYDNADNRITISQDSLEHNKSWILVSTLCHEMYHAYQEQLVKLYIKADPEEQNLEIFRPIKKYLEEYKDYVSPEEDVEGYFRQQSETDARKYAQEATIRYYKYIKENL